MTATQMDIRQAISHLVDKHDLSQAEMMSVMRQIMSGEASDAQIAGFLIALRLKGETIDEICGAAMVMRQLATKVDIECEALVDTCGTGGDGAHLFNVSTAAAFVVAATGGHVAKHGNRSVSSSTGSADVLEAAGVNLSLEANDVARAIESVGVGFMFAQAHHSAMKHAIGPRKELGLRTIFNMLGPMTNPAGVKRQVIGVYDAALCRPIAEVLLRLGSEHVLVVHSEDGLDELSIAADNHVAELRDKKISEYKLSPESCGIARCDLSGLSVSNAQASLALINGAFLQDESPSSRKAASIIALNAGAALYVSGIASSIKQGVDMACDSIDSGGAQEKLKELVEFTQLAAQA